MHTPRKRFGQHFLCDPSIIQKIINVIAPKPEDHLVEIGPGQGALTIPILKIAKKLEAIELDRDLINELKTRSKNVGDLIIFSADALQFDFASLKKDERKLKVFGNLPYNISTPLIFHLLRCIDQIQDMNFMLQKEVAERLAAHCNTEHYGRLSVMVQYHCDVQLLFDVPNTAFYPPPKVTSSIVELIPHCKIPFPVNNYSLFEKIVKLAFSQRRKTLRNSLKTLIDDKTWSILPIRSDLRAENISVEQFAIMANAINTREVI